MLFSDLINRKYTGTDLLNKNSVSTLDVMLKQVFIPISQKDIKDFLSKGGKLRCSRNKALKSFSKSDLENALKKKIILN